MTGGSKGADTRYTVYGIQQVRKQTEPARSNSIHTTAITQQHQQKRPSSLMARGEKGCEKKVKEAFQRQVILKRTINEGGAVEAPLHCVLHE